MKLYIVRHGQTDWNVIKRFQGVSDIPLNENGLKQAQRLADRLHSVHIDAAYASPMKRTQQTANAVLQGRDIELQIEPSLIEINGGVWEGQLFTDLETKDPDKWLRFRNEPSKLKFDQGDIVTERIAETADLLHRLYAKHPQDSVLLATHGFTSRMLCSAFMDIDIDKINLIRFGNCSLTIFEQRENKKNVYCINDCAHTE